MSAVRPHSNVTLHSFILHPIYIPRCYLFFVLWFNSFRKYIIWLLKLLTRKSLSLLQSNPDNLFYRSLTPRTTDAQWSLFHWNPELLELGRQIGQINSGAFEVFSAKLSAPFWCSESLVHVFHYSTLISTKKLSLYIHTPNVYLGLGFEFKYGPQRIRDLAFLCPKSVSIPYMQKSELGCATSRDLLCLKLVSQIVETIKACVNVWH